MDRTRHIDRDPPRARRLDPRLVGDHRGLEADGLVARRVRAARGRAASQSADQQLRRRHPAQSDPAPRLHADRRSAVVRPLPPPRPRRVLQLGHGRPVGYAPRPAAGDGRLPLRVLVEERGGVARGHRRVDGTAPRGPPAGRSVRPVRRERLDRGGAHVGHVARRAHARHAALVQAATTPADRARGAAARDHRRAPARRVLRGGR